jgi:hypothetical protein
MTEQPTALYLAEILQSEPGAVADAASAELRRLHAVNQELLDALKQMLEVWEEDPAYGATHADKARAAIARAEGEV